MKKVNLKEIDVKKLAFEHCEKAVLLLVVGFMGWLVYGALQTEPYDKTPETLENGLADVRRHVESASLEKYKQTAGNKPGKSIPELPATPYQLMVAGLQKPIDPDEFRQRDMHRNVMPPSKKRGIPATFALEGVQATPGFGPFAVKGEANAGVAAPEVVTAPKRVAAPPPVRRVGAAQQNAGRANFAQRVAQNNQNRARPGQPNNKQPVNAAPEIVRNAPGGGNLRGMLGVNQAGKDGRVEGRRWIVLTGAVPFVAQQKEFFEKLHTTQLNVRKQDFVEYVGPRIERAEVVAGATDLKWEPVPTDHLASEVESWEQVVVEPVAAEFLQPSLVMPLPPLIGRGWDPAAVTHPKIPTLKQKELEEAAKQEVAEEAKEEDEGPSGPAGVVLIAPKKAEKTDIKKELTKATDEVKQVQMYHLFRFFDFTVQPGKTYRYRVQLVMNNPNSNIPITDLADPKSGASPYIETPWSEITSPVTIELDSHLLVGPVVMQPGKETHVKVMLRQWDNKQGANVSHEFALHRGQVANFNQVVRLVIPGRAPINVQVNFKTDLMLLDFTGGEKVKPRSKFTEPTQAVFVSGDGSLISRSETGDKEEWDEELKRRADAENTSAEEPGPGGLPNIFNFNNNPGNGPPGRNAPK